MLRSYSTSRISVKFGQKTLTIVDKQYICFAAFQICVQTAIESLNRTQRVHLMPNYEVLYRMIE